METYSAGKINPVAMFASFARAQPDELTESFLFAAFFRFATRREHPRTKDEGTSRPSVNLATSHQYRAGRKFFVSFDIGASFLRRKGNKKIFFLSPERKMASFDVAKPFKAAQEVSSIYLILKGITGKTSPSLLRPERGMI